MRLSIPQYAEALLDLEKGITPDQAESTAKSFVSWLARRGESKKLPTIVSQAGKMIADRSGIVDVEIVSAKPLEAGREISIIGQAKELFPGKEIRARFVTNPELIGGAQFRSEEVLYDASISGTVKKLRSSLVR